MPAQVTQSLQVQAAVLRRTISALQAHQSATERGYAMRMTRTEQEEREDQLRLQEALAQSAAPGAETHSMSASHLGCRRMMLHVFGAHALRSVRCSSTCMPDTSCLTSRCRTSVLSWRTAKRSLRLRRIGRTRQRPSLLRLRLRHSDSLRSWQTLTQSYSRRLTAWHRRYELVPLAAGSVCRSGASYQSSCATGAPHQVCCMQQERDARMLEQQLQEHRALASESQRQVISDSVGGLRGWSAVHAVFELPGRRWPTVGPFSVTESTSFFALSSAVEPSPLSSTMMLSVGCKVGDFGGPAYGSGSEALLRWEAPPVCYGLHRLRRGPDSTCGCDATGELADRDMQVRQLQQELSQAQAGADAASREKV